MKADQLCSSNLMLRIVPRGDDLGAEHRQAHCYAKGKRKYRI